MGLILHGINTQYHCMKLILKGINKYNHHFNACSADKYYRASSDINTKNTNRFFRLEGWYILPIILQQSGIILHVLGLCSRSSHSSNVRIHKYLYLKCIGTDNSIANRNPPSAQDSNQRYKFFKSISRISPFYSQVTESSIETFHN